ncbi:MAG TPA: hypothetical protein VGQ84_02585 [Gaiellaceae bacterium]|nr:hypothetical protein [Gaiellaceae bacterium]
MDRRERERIMREGGVADSGRLERADSRRLAEDLEGSPLRGQPLRQRLRNFRPAVENYLASLSGPRPYMQRLREIEQETGRHERRLAEARRALAAECGGDPAAFARRWRRIAERWRFDDVNELIERHNRFFPTESRLPMDPRTGDFVLFDGERYERRPLDRDWILDRFPAEYASAA